MNKHLLCLFFANNPNLTALCLLACAVQPPSGPNALRLFSARALAALGNLLTSSLPPSAPGIPTHTHSLASLPPPAQSALCLLVRVCDCLRPRHISGGLVAVGMGGSSVPLLLTAQPGGVKLAASVRQLLSDWATQVEACMDVGMGGSKAVNEGGSSQPGASQAEEPVQTRRGAKRKAAEVLPAVAVGEGEGAEGYPLRSLLTPPLLAAAWACLQLIPHACEASSQSVALCQRVQQAVQCVLGPGTGVHAVGGGELLSPAVELKGAVVEALLCLHGTATELLAGMLGQEAEEAEGNSATLEGLAQQLLAGWCQGQSLQSWLELDSSVLQSDFVRPQRTEEPRSNPPNVRGLKTLHGRQRAEEPGSRPL